MQNSHALILSNGRSEVNRIRKAIICGDCCGNIGSVKSDLKVYGMKNSNSTDPGRSASVYGGTNFGVLRCNGTI